MPDSWADAAEMRRLEDGADAEENHAERDLAQKSMRLQIIVGDKVETGRADEHADEQVARDLGSTQKLRHVTRDKRREQDQTNGQDLVQRPSLINAKKRSLPSWK